MPKTKKQIIREVLPEPTLEERVRYYLADLASAARSTRLSYEREAKWYVEHCQRIANTPPSVVDRYNTVDADRVVRTLEEYRAAHQLFALAAINLLPNEVKIARAISHSFEWKTP